MTRDDEMKKRAIDAFSRHGIREHDGRSYLLQKRYPDTDQFSSGFWTEVHVGWGGLYVGGDIETVMFAGGPSDHDSRLCWMGATNDVSYYVRQKAFLGSRGKGAEVWDHEIAVRSVRDWIAEERRDGEPGGLIPIEEWLGRRWGTPETRELFLHELHDVAPPNWLDDRWDVGMVTAPCVYYAWAAVRRICELRGLL